MNQFDRKARYTFDSERDTTETELCRQGSEACITVRVAVRDGVRNEYIVNTARHEFETAVYCYARTRILLCAAVESQEIAHGMSTLGDGMNASHSRFLV